MDRRTIEPLPKEPKVITKDLRANIHNRFDIEVFDTRTGEVRQKARAFNVICNNLWTHMSSYSAYIAYGNGNGTPSSSDTTLFGIWNAVSASLHKRSSGEDTGIAYRTQKIVLSETVSVGMTITEVGLAYGSTSGSLCTHAMIEDMNGNPISITKTATDIVTIYATVFVHWDRFGYDGIILAPAQSYSSCQSVIDYLLGQGWTSSGTYLNCFVGAGTHSMTDVGTACSLTFDTTNKVITLKCGRIPVDMGNLTGGFGWLAFMYRYMRNYSSVYNSWIVDLRGDYEIKGEAVGTGDGTTTNFNTKFDMPFNARVYIDGTEKTSGVTIRNTPVRTNPFLYLLRIQGKPVDGRLQILSGPQTTPGADTVTPVYLYNPLHEFGIYSCMHPYGANPTSQLSFSDDFETWSPYYITGVDSYSVVPEEYRHCKYIRMKAYGSGTWSSSTTEEVGTFPSDVSSGNIVFDEPPAEGSVITIDYHTPFVPKDSNHVYDLTLTIQLGEYTGDE